MPNFGVMPVVLVGAVSGYIKGQEGRGFFNKPSSGRVGDEGVLPRFIEAIVVVESCDGWGGREEVEEGEE